MPWAGGKRKGEAAHAPSGARAFCRVTRVEVSA